MNIKHTNIAKLLVQDIEGLNDDIVIILESTGPKRGLATVRYGEHSWNSFWNAMPQASIAEFFAKAPCDYLLDAMSNIPTHLPDYVTLQRKALTALLKLRRAKDIGREDTREHYDKIHSMERPHNCSESLQVALGQEWWQCVDTMPNPFYAFAETVMTAAQVAVRHAIASGDLRIE